MREVRKGNWSAQELERLKNLYPQGGEGHASSILRRSVVSVRKRVLRLFGAKKRKGPWSTEEDQQLRLSFGVLDLRGLCLVLARTRKDVLERIRQFRQKRRRGPWSRTEEFLLKRVYANRADEDVEVCLSRSRARIAAMAARLCLAKDKKFTARTTNSSTASRTPMPRWSSTEVRQLEELYLDRDNLDIAKVLGRSVASVANKASQLGLRKSRLALARMGRENVGFRHRTGS